MAWDDEFRIHARCPVHIRFNPARGQGAIKAGCSLCWELVQLYRAWETIKLRVKSYRDATPARRTP